MTGLTKKEKGFADTFLETGNGTQSALENYDTDDENSAAVIASRTLRKAKVQQYLEEQGGDAITRIVQLSISAENESVRLNANKDIADRAGWKPVEKSVNLNIEAEITNPHAKELADEYETKLKQGL